MGARGHQAVGDSGPGFERRLARAEALVEQAGLAGLLVTPSADLVYLAGYDPTPLPRLTCLVVRPGSDPVLLVPELERPLARASPAGGLYEVVGWRDGEDPYDLLWRWLADGAAYAITDRAWAAHVLGILKVASGRIELVPASRGVPALRAVKDAGEVSLLTAAAHAADRAFARLCDEGLAGRTEADVAARLAALLVEEGHDSAAFTIVGSGPNGASPHHEPSDRRIEEGEGVVLDFGGRVGGYCSDITRTVFVGEPHQEFLRVYATVQEAQQRAVDAIGPGVMPEDVDRVARDVIDAAGFGDRFVHRTGHGIGLEEHEPPSIVAGNREPLEPGMCFSVEPGIYLEGRFGVRIEDIVVVTDDGATRLNEASRDLRTVG